MLGTAAEAMPLKRVDNRPQALDLDLENLENIKLMGLFENERAQRVNVVRQVRFHEDGNSESGVEGAVNRQTAVPSGSASGLLQKSTGRVATIMRAPAPGLIIA